MSDKQINQEISEPISRLPERGQSKDDDLYALFRSSSSFNYKLVYSQFVQRLVSDLSARLGLRSMAFME